MVPNNMLFKTFDSFFESLFLIVRYVLYLSFSFLFFTFWRGLCVSPIGIVLPCTYPISFNIVCLFGKTSPFQDLDSALHYFSKIFTHTADSHAPYKTFRIKNWSNPWFSPELALAIHNRNKLCSIARASGTNTVWQNFRQQRNGAFIRKAKSDSYLSSFSKCNCNGAAFWKYIKSLKNTLLPLVIIGENEPIINKSDMTEAFNKHFIAECDTKTCPYTLSETKLTKS